MYRFTWKGRAPEEFAHIALGVIIGYLVAIAVAPYMGTTVMFNLPTALASIIIAVGFAWILDSVGVGRAIPGRWEYIIYCGLGIATFNFITTQGLVPLTPVDVFTGLMPKDPMTVLRGFIYGAVGGFIISLAEGLTFHHIGGRPSSTSSRRAGVAG